jgi:hypothetical protein
VVWQRFNDARGFVEKEYALHGPDFREIAADGSLGA